MRSFDRYRRSNAWSTDQLDALESQLCWRSVHLEQAIKRSRITSQPSHHAFVLCGNVFQEVTDTWKLRKVMRRLAAVRSAQERARNEALAADPDIGSARSIHEDDSKPRSYFVDFSPKYTVRSTRAAESVNVRAAIGVWPTKTRSREYLKEHTRLLGSY